MKTRNLLLLTAISVSIAASGTAIGQGHGQTVPVPSGGPLGTMPHGTYECVLPGDAGGDAYVVIEDEGFRISTASRYENGEGSGTYIMRGKDLTFTFGPKKGERYVRVGDNQLRKLDAEGARTRLLCTRLIGRR